ncbi:MAG: hypothetical protein IJS15_01425 [Victivallales bacterium]|nr:hypothetical protein [Victivallales bacterium]
MSKLQNRQLKKVGQLITNARDLLEIVTEDVKSDTEKVMQILYGVRQKLENEPQAMQLQIPGLLDDKMPNKRKHWLARGIEYQEEGKSYFIKTCGIRELIKLIRQRAPAYAANISLLKKPAYRFNSCEEDMLILANFVNNAIDSTHSKLRITALRKDTSLSYEGEKATYTVYPKTMEVTKGKAILEK